MINTIWMDNAPLLAERVYRIRQVAPDDCIVEFLKKDGTWEAEDSDTVCAQVYMKAFLEVRKGPNDR